ncbi:MAG: hypothetical protein IJR85_00185 [Synergistaceae bacterium]|nr:hypothetical protein [Synergistaceae bacterium]
MWERDSTRFNPFSKIHQDKIPYIIRREAGNVGLFSYFITILGGIAYAEQNGYIPVVDMKHYPNAYLYESEYGLVNSWEYFFEQPDGLSLEEALSCRKYILGKDTALFLRPAQTAKFFLNQDGKLDYWRKICRKYIRFTPPVLEHLQRLLRKTQGKKILGVLVRGTDYTSLKPKHHPVQPTAEQAVAKTQEVLEGGDFEAVYLATEDKRILAKFQEAFGEKLILPESRCFDYDYDSPEYLCKYMNNDKYSLGLDYLVSMLFLSKCKGFITSLTSGSTGVMCLSEGFDYLYVFDLGVYE